MREWENILEIWDYSISSFWRRGNSSCFNNYGGEYFAINGFDCIVCGKINWRGHSLNGIDDMSANFTINVSRGSVRI